MTRKAKIVATVGPASRSEETLEKLILAEGPETVAAFIAEPVMGGGGVIVPPKTYFQKVQAVLKKYDVLMVADEVICGFGRTGNWWGSQTFGMKPDIMTMAKQLSAGFMPVAAIMMNSKVYEALRDNSNKNVTFAHGITYSGHPASAACAVEVLKIYEEQKIVERDDAFLLTLRPEGTHLAGHWEFPGGKCEPGEPIGACLTREIQEELLERVERSIGLARAECKGLGKRRYAA